MGTESGKETGKAGAPAAGADQDEGKTFDEIFDSAMNEPEGDGGAASTGDGAGSGTGDGTDKAGTGDGKTAPPAGDSSGTTDQDGGETTGAGSEGTAGTKTAATGEGEGGGKPSLTDEDRAFLKSVDLEGYEATPAELKNLRKVHGKMNGIIETERKQKEFFGNSNKDLSAKFKKLKGAYREIMNQQTPEDRVKGVISKIDQSKLSPQGRELLNDPAFQEVNSAILGLLVPTDKTGPDGISLEDDDDLGAGGAASAAGSAGAGTGTPGAGAGAGEPTREEIEGQVREHIHSAATVLKDVHPDMLTIYGSQDFGVYFRGLSTIEKMKAFSNEPQAHNEILTGYKTYKASKDAEAEATTASRQKNDSLRTHQAPSSPGQKGQPSDGPTPEQIMNDDATYNDMEQRVRKAAVRTG